MATTKRAQIPLSDQDLKDLALMGESTDAARLIHFEGDASQASEAALLSAMVRYAMTQAKEAAMEAGYAALAQDPEWSAVAKARRGRRAHRAATDWDAV